MHEIDPSPQTGSHRTSARDALDTHAERLYNRERWSYRRRIALMLAIAGTGISASYGTSMLLWFGNIYSGLFDFAFAALHAVAFLWVRQDHLRAAAYWTMCLAIVQISMGTVLFIGPEGGFQYYLFVMPVVAHLAFSDDAVWPRALMTLAGFAMFALAEEIRRQLDATPVPTIKAPIQLTASIGVSCAGGPDGEDCDDLDTLIGLADEALYAAKSAGRNRVIARHPERPSAVAAY